MKFTFKFQSLLKIRQYEVDREQQKLGKLLNEKLQFEKRMSVLKKKIHGYGHPGEALEALNALEIRQYYEFKKDLHEKLWQLEQKLVRWKKKIEIQRRKLFEANKRSQVIEKLEKKDRAKFVKQMLDREQKQQNEIAIQMYNRDG